MFVFNLAHLTKTIATTALLSFATLHGTHYASHTVIKKTTPNTHVVRNSRDLAENGHPILSSGGCNTLPPTSFNMTTVSAKVCLQKDEYNWIHISLIYSGLDNPSTYNPLWADSTKPNLPYIYLAVHNKTTKRIDIFIRSSVDRSQPSVDCNLPIV